MTQKAIQTTLLAPMLFCFLFLLACFFLYGSAGHDDSHITYWASYTLSQFGEIVNYNGNRIEQSSSLLLTLITAFIAFIFKSDVVVSGYLITYTSGAIAVWLTFAMAQHHFGLSRKQASYCILLLCSSPAFMLWNSSGMESTLAAVCLLAFTWAWSNLLSETKPINSLSLTGAAFYTICLISVRPEMISLAAGLVFLIFIWKRHTKTRGSLPLLVFYSTILLCICLLVGWRYFYFNAFMPLPVYAKVSPLSFDKMLSGTFYFLRYGFINLIFVIGLVSAVLFLINTLRFKINGQQIGYPTLLSALIITAYSGFIWLSGGDWMQSGRFLVPILPLCALSGAQWLNRLNKPKITTAVFVIVLVAHGYGHFVALAHQSHGTPVWASYRITPEHQQRYSLFEQLNQEHLRDMEVIDHLDHVISDLLQTNHNIPPILASGQSGMVYFYTAKKYFGKVHFYDNRGLVESSLLKCKVLNDIPRNAQGLVLNHDGFFKRLASLQQYCNIKKPDILYDINDMSRQLPNRMEAYGYTLIHREGGRMIETTSSLPINALPAPNFLMVKNTLLDQLSHPELTTVKYKNIPLVKRLSF